MFDEGTLWCATQKTAHIVTCLGQDARCGFEIAPEAPPYRGVRGQSRATLHEDLGEPILLRLIDRYVGNRESNFARWLIKRADKEVAIRIEPTWITSWDFSGRMGQ